MFVLSVSALTEYVMIDVRERRGSSAAAILLLHNACLMDIDIALGCSSNNKILGSSVLSHTNLTLANYLIIILKPAATMVWSLKSCANLSDELIIPPQSPTSHKSSTPQSSKSRPPSRLSTDRRVDSSGFRATRSNKCTIIHSALLSRIEESNPSSKRRRVRSPSRKLITYLQSLGEALSQGSETKNRQTMIGDTGIKNKSLKCRPGALTKRETLITMEKKIQQEHFSNDIV